MQPATYELAPTHPAAIAAWAEWDPAGIAVRFVRDGTSTEWTRHEYAAAVGRVAAAFAVAGLRPGDRVGIVGPSDPNWLVIAEGTQAAGGVIVGAYPTSAPSQLAYVFGHSGARFVFVADDETAARIASVRGTLPDLDHVVTFDGSSANGTPLEEFLDGTPCRGDAAVAYLCDAAARLDPDDLCTIVYTSGTTGAPKGAMHTFRTIGQVADTVGPSMGYTPDDEYVVYLPLNHTAEQTYTIVLGAQCGFTLNFARSMLTLPDDLVTIRPTVMFGVPRIFEKVRETIEQNVSAPTTEGHPLAPFGLDRLRVAVCGGAPLARELVEFFAGLGLRMCNTYGMTEAGAIASAWDRAPRGDTCGVPFPGVEVRLDADDEVLVRSSGVCLGYYRDDAATAEMFTEDGFLRTGDLGRLTEDGELQVVDRKKDIIITAAGKNISPSAIEHLLARSPYLNHAVVVGNGRRYLVAVLEVAVEPVTALLTERGEAAASIDEMVRSAAVLEAAAVAVERANAELSRPEQIKAWAILPRALLPSDPEVTPTMKVKRRQFESRYADVIESLYA